MAFRLIIHAWIDGQLSTTRFSFLSFDRAADFIKKNHREFNARRIKIYHDQELVFNTGPGNYTAYT
jgi:hypothetical protein